MDIPKKLVVKLDIGSRVEDPLFRRKEGVLFAMEIVGGSDCLIEAEMFGPIQVWGNGGLDDIGKDLLDEMFESCR